MSESAFIFDNKLSESFDGFSFGSAFRAYFSKYILMSLRKKLWLEKCPPEFKPVVYRRYIDKIFVWFMPKDHLLSLARYMNTRHKNLKFAFDFEQIDRIFLKC